MAPPHPLGQPFGRQVRDASPWLTAHPELTTRPELVELMKIDRSFRRAMLKKLAVLRAVPDIRDNQIARHCLVLAYTHARAALVEYWQDRMSDAGLHREMAQAVGVLRNVHLNMLHEIDPSKTRSCKWWPYDVRPEG